jgi:hypothetical protein
MLSEAGQIAIDALLTEINPERLSKMHLRKLQAIKVKETGVRDNECFCRPDKRQKWFAEFNTWYEKNAR